MNIWNLELYANLEGKFTARHWLDVESKTRFMQLCGVIFKYDPMLELWKFWEEDNNADRDEI